MYYFIDNKRTYLIYFLLSKITAYKGVARRFYLLLLRVQKVVKDNLYIFGADKVDLQLAKFTAEKMLYRSQKKKKCMADGGMRILRYSTGII